MGNSKKLSPLLLDYIIQSILVLINIMNMFYLDITAFILPSTLWGKHIGSWK